MNDDKDNFENKDLEHLVIKDKAYKRKKLKKRILIFLGILIGLGIIVTIIIAILIAIFSRSHGSITCFYITKYDKENITLINYKKDLKFSLIIDGKSFDQEYSHIFEDSGIHKVIFSFKKINSLADLFKNNGALINADLSLFSIEDITSLNNLFSNCIKLENVTFNFSSKNSIESMNNLFGHCSKLKFVSFNFSAEKLKDMTGAFQFCYALKNFKLDIFNTKNLKYMDEVFS